MAELRGKGTTVDKLKEKLPNSQTWSPEPSESAEQGLGPGLVLNSSQVCHIVLELLAFLAGNQIRKPPFLGDPRKEDTHVAQWVLLARYVPW